MDEPTREESLKILIEELKQTQDRISSLFTLPTRGERPVLSDDISTAAAEEQDSFISSRLSAKSAENLNLIQKALKLAKLGKYGICVSCKNEIPLERLQSLPLATRCVRCQEKVEK